MQAALDVGADGVRCSSGGPQVQPRRVLVRVQPES
jgi:hypothetical protein